MSNTSVLHDILARAETWPIEWQQELAEFARSMEAAHQGKRYRASAEEMVGIQEGLRDAAAGNFASAEEIATIFARYGAE